MSRHKFKDKWIVCDFDAKQETKKKKIKHLSVFGI